jgi:transcriptional regulator with XRE-family HTH domain
MQSPAKLVREARLATGLSQRDLAKRADTSQPAVARYESGAVSPSWETLQRLIGACGRQLRVSTELALDPADVELALRQLELTPLQRLHALRRFARLRALSEAPQK